MSKQSSPSTKSPPRGAANGSDSEEDVDYSDLPPQEDIPEDEMDPKWIARKYAWVGTTPQLKIGLPSTQITGSTLGDKKTDSMPYPGARIVIPKRNKYEMYPRVLSLHLEGEISAKPVTPLVGSNSKPWLSSPSTTVHRHLGSVLYSSVPSPEEATKRLLEAFRRQGEESI